MLRIELESKAQQALELQHLNALKFKPYNILNNLKILLTDPIFITEKNVTRYLIQNLDDIIIGKASTLSRIKAEWDILIAGLANNHSFIQYIDFLQKNIFSYSRFSRFKKTKYCAHSLATSIGMKTCPYCNRAYIVSWNKVNSAARCQFDHFISKSRYPIFAVSLYNIVPSCSICNTVEKHNAQFNFDDNINPWFLCGDEIFRFKLVQDNGEEIEDPTFWYGVDVESRLKITISPQEGVSVDSSEYRAFLENARVFRIIEYYGHHLDYAVDIVRKGHLYPLNYLQQLQNLMLQKNVTLIGAKELYYGSYLFSADFHRRTLNKLTKDILVQFGLI